MQHGQTPLHYTAGVNAAESAKLLLAAKASLEPKFYLVSALLCAQVDECAQAETTPDCGQTALYFAAGQNSTEVLQILLAAKALVDSKMNVSARTNCNCVCDGVGQLTRTSALHLAATKNNSKAVKLLLAAKASFEIKTRANRMTVCSSPSMLGY